MSRARARARIASREKFALYAQAASKNLRQVLERTRGNQFAYDKRMSGGRFLSIDPVVTDANTGGSFNRYAYANNSPYKYVDPDGRNAALAGQAALGGTFVCGPICGLVAGGTVLIGGTYVTAKIVNWMQSGSETPAAPGDKKTGDKDPSTPTGQSGSPMDVPKGTNEPANIGGRDYTGHALDQSQGRGLTPTVVEDAITTGTARPDKKYPDRTEHTSQDGRVQAITDKESGRVITVITK